MGMKPRAKPRPTPATEGYLPIYLDDRWQVGYVEWRHAVKGSGVRSVVSRVLPGRYSERAAAAEASYQNLRAGHGPPEVAEMAEALANRFAAVESKGAFATTQMLRSAANALRAHAKQVR